MNMRTTEIEDGNGWRGKTITVTLERYDEDDGKQKHVTSVHAKNGSGRRTRLLFVSNVTENPIIALADYREQVGKNTKEGWQVTEKLNG